MAFGARDTKLICCRENMRGAESFLGRLDVSGPLENLSCALGINSDALFLFNCGANGCGGMGC